MVQQVYIPYNKKKPDVINLNNIYINHVKHFRNYLFCFQLTCLIMRKSLISYLNIVLFVKDFRFFCWGNNHSTYILCMCFWFIQIGIVISWQFTSYKIYTYIENKMLFALNSWLWYMLLNPLTKDPITLLSSNFWHPKT